MRRDTPLYCLDRRRRDDAYIISKSVGVLKRVGGVERKLVGMKAKILSLRGRGIGGEKRTWLAQRCSGQRASPMSYHYQKLLLAWLLVLPLLVEATALIETVIS